MIRTSPRTTRSVPRRLARSGAPATRSSRPALRRPFRQRHVRRQPLRSPTAATPAIWACGTTSRPRSASDYIQWLSQMNGVFYYIGFPTITPTVQPNPGFNPGSIAPVRLANVTDGMSNTIAFGEHAHGAFSQDLGPRLHGHRYQRLEPVDLRQLRRHALHHPLPDQHLEEARQRQWKPELRHSGRRRGPLGRQLPPRRVELRHAGWLGPIPQGHRIDLDVWGQRSP